MTAIGISIAFFVAGLAYLIGDSLIKGKPLFCRLIWSIRYAISPMHPKLLNHLKNHRYVQHTRSYIDSRRYS